MTGQRHVVVKCRFFLNSFTGIAKWFLVGKMSIDFQWTNKSQRANEHRKRTSQWVSQNKHKQTTRRKSFNGRHSDVVTLCNLTNRSIPEYTKAVAASGVPQLAPKAKSRTIHLSTSSFSFLLLFPPPQLPPVFTPLVRKFHQLDIFSWREFFSLYKFDGIQSTHWSVPTDSSIIDNRLKY